jgi:hypothetical protein
MLLLFNLFFSLPACSQSGETKVVLVENSDTMVVMKIQSTDGNATAFDAQGAAFTESPNYTVYYHEGAEGFTSPEWEGFTTELW